MKKKTRDEILNILRERGKCTVNTLAEGAGISPVSVRHHLNSLQAEQLVEFEEERHGVGRPHMLYFLSEKGQEQHPTRYLRLTNRILAHLKMIMPMEKIEEIMDQVADSMADEYAQDLSSYPPQKRLEKLRDYLLEEGFSVQIDQDGEDLFLHELSCPYLHVGREHPEVCMIDEAFLSKALALPIKRVRCQLNGDTRCTFKVETQSPETAHV